MRQEERQYGNSKPAWEEQQSRDNDGGVSEMHNTVCDNQRRNESQMRRNNSEHSFGLWWFWGCSCWNIASHIFSLSWYSLWERVRLDSLVKNEGTMTRTWTWARKCDDKHTHSISVYDSSCSHSVSALRGGLQLSVRCVSLRQLFTALHRGKQQDAWVYTFSNQHWWHLTACSHTKLCLNVYNEKYKTICW